MIYRPMLLSFWGPAYYNPQFKQALLSDRYRDWWYEFVLSVIGEEMRVFIEPV